MYLLINETPLCETMVDNGSGFLGKIIQNCQSLVSLGLEDIYDEHFENEMNAGAAKLNHLLACNRAKNRIGFGIPAKSTRMAPMLLPMIIENPTPVFKSYDNPDDIKDTILTCHYLTEDWFKIDVRKIDAVYALLSILRGSFVDTLSHRS